MIKRALMLAGALLSVAPFGSTWAAPKPVVAYTGPASAALPGANVDLGPSVRDGLATPVTDSDGATCENASAVEDAEFVWNLSLPQVGLSCVVSTSLRTRSGDEVHSPRTHRVYPCTQRSLVEKVQQIAQDECTYARLAARTNAKVSLDAADKPPAVAVPQPAVPAVAAAAPASTSSSPQGAAATRTWMSGAGLVLVAAGIAAGTGAVIGLARHEQWTDDFSRAADGSTVGDRHRRDWTTWTATVASAGLLVTGVVFWVVDSPPSRTVSVSVAPNSLSLTGRF